MYIFYVKIIEKYITGKQYLRKLRVGKLAVSCDVMSPMPRPGTIEGPAGGGTVSKNCKTRSYFADHFPSRVSNHFQSHSE